MYKLEIFCQPEQKGQVLSTLHEAGVDRIGNYDHCWAIGSFIGSHRALTGSKPVFGLVGEVENYPLLKIDPRAAAHLYLDFVQFAALHIIKRMYLMLIRG